MKIAPIRQESGFDKQLGLNILGMLVSNSQPISFYTKNIKAWKTNFYSLRKIVSPNSKFTFAMDKEKGVGWFLVWKFA